ncbi:MAG: PAS domain S-box protein [Thermodesulfobacteriota bacterium]|nr:PAS domain S-box protein [Thermodesulfobacteriota bacterium]
MVYKFNQRISIKTRLQRVSLVSIVVFMVIALSVYFASSMVQQNIDQTVEESLQQTIKNSQNGRDFGLLHARLSTFQNTFYADDELLETEGVSLLEDFGAIQVDVDNSHLRDLLGQLKRELFLYLEHCKWINYLLLWRSGQDNDLNELLLFVQEIIAEKTVEVVLSGGDADYFEQLVLLTSGYRESILEIAKLNAEENRSRLLSASIDSPFPLEAELRSLRSRLQTLTASEPPIDRLGQHLLSQLAYYQHLMRQYQQEMVRLGERNRQMEQLTAQIVSIMGQLDGQTVAAATEARAEIRKSLNTAVAVALGFLGLLAGVYWFSHRNLFRRHIQAPIDLINARLEKFQQGDHSSPMQLGRDDEWDEIEVVFNRMLIDLQESLFALQKSEKRYRDIFTNATEGIFRTSISGQFLELNPAAVAMLGYDTAEDAFTSFSDLDQQLYQNPHDREQMLTRLYEQESLLNYEVVMLRKNGDIFWASLNNHLIRNDEGDILYIEGTVRDISAQRAAQEALQQLHVYLQNIIDSMPSVLICVDINLKITLWNKRAEQESVLTAEQVHGLSMTDVCHLFEPTTYISKLSETIRTRKPTRLLKVESTKKAKDGNNRYFDILIYPLSLTKASGAVIHMDDVTERLQLEEMMVRSEKMQSIGGLAAGLAHEINNPLAVILQNVQVLSRRLSPDLNKNREIAQELGITIETIVEYTRLRGCEKMIHSISDAGQRAAKIVENMQSFSRRGGSNFIPCAISDLLEKTIELAGSDHDMRHHFDFRKIRIVRDYHSISNVCCDASQIQQVFLSLLKNAAQALSNNIDDPQVTLRLLPSGEDHVRVQIEDNGPGMKEELVAKIFDPFYTTQEVGQGTGLGLSVAYFIATQNHKGSLSVVSKVGAGSCFDLVLPLSHEEESFVF